MKFKRNIYSRVLRIVDAIVVLILVCLSSLVSAQASVLVTQSTTASELTTQATTISEFNAQASVLASNTTVTTAIDSSDTSDAYNNVIDYCNKNGYTYYDSYEAAYSAVESYLAGVCWDDEEGIKVAYKGDVCLLDKFKTPDAVSVADSYAGFMFQVTGGWYMWSSDTETYYAVNVKRCAYETHYSGLTKEQATQAEEKIDSVVKSLSSLSDYEKIKYVYNYICTNMSYDTTLVKGSIYDAMITGSTVCSGYAGAFQLFMEKLGIKSYLCAGIVSGTGHAWNAVYLEGQYYYVDTTFADTGNKMWYLLFGTNLRADIYELGIADHTYGMTKTEVAQETVKPSEVETSEETKQTQPDTSTGNGPTSASGTGGTSSGNGSDSNTANTGSDGSSVSGDNGGLQAETGDTTDDVDDTTTDSSSDDASDTSTGDIYGDGHTDGSSQGETYDVDNDSMDGNSGELDTTNQRDNKNSSVVAAVIASAVTASGVAVGASAGAAVHRRRRR